jgi:hypothetical protein
MSSISIDGKEFITLATFVMCNDNPENNKDVDMKIIHSVLDQIAINCLGFSDWVQAYHELDADGERILTTNHY